MYLIYIKRIVNSKINNNGFTIIELIISLNLFFALVTIVSCSTKILERIELSNSAVNLQNNIRHIQKMAYIENTEYTMLFSQEDNSFIIEKYTNGEQKHIKKVYFKNVVKQYLTTAKSNEIRFTSKGVTNTPCTINLISKDYYIKITINLGAGKVKVHNIQKKKK